MHNPAPLSRRVLDSATSSRTKDANAVRLLLDLFKRGLPIIATTTAIFLGLGVLYLLVTPSRYTALSSLILDTRRTNPLAPDNSAEALIDTAAVDSHVETLRSERIALAVINRQGLLNDPEFVGDGPGAIQSFLSFIGLGSPEDEAQSETAIAVASFKRSLTILRVGRSYVTEIMFTSLDAQKSANIANAVAEAYTQDQFDAKLENTRRTIDWMQSRIEELRKLAADAFGAAEDFRAEDVSSTRDGQTKLRELETRAQTFNSIYQTFLTRYIQTIQQQTFPGTEARIVTRASAPLSRSSPKTTLTLFLALLAGLGTGLAIAFTREQLDRRIRSVTFLEHGLGIRAIGTLPEIERRHRRNEIPTLFEPARPFAPAAEALRAIKVAIDGTGSQGDAKIIGITSPFRGEGRTTIAYGLAVLMAESRRKVLLIDGDFRDPKLTKVLSPDLKNTLVDVLSGAAKLSEAITTQHGFDFIGEPARQKAHPADYLSSVAMRNLFAATRKSYDYVLIDLASALQHADVRASAHLIDHFILVAEWGRTTLDDIERTLASSENLEERLLGVIVNKSPTESG